MEFKLQLPSKLCQVIRSQLKRRMINVLINVHILIIYNPDDDYDYDEDEKNLWSIIGTATCVASFFQVAPIRLVEGGHKTELSLSL